MQTSNHQTTKTGRFRARVAGMTFLAVICFNAVGGMSASGGEAVTDRAADRLSAEAFAEPPLNARPGSFLGLAQRIDHQGTNHAGSDGDERGRYARR